MSSSIEVNLHGDQILGGVAGQALVDGRMVLPFAAGDSYDFGSRTDLPKYRYPTSAAEAALSKYLVRFADDNRGLPIYSPATTLSFGLRQGFDQTANSPMTSQTVYPMHPADYSTPQTIASGDLIKVYPEGVFTVSSGGFVYSASLAVPGAQLTVEHTAGSDQGKLKYGTSNVVGEVIMFNSDASLTFRIK